MRTPNFVLSEQLVFRIDIMDSRVLPAGTFIRPIEIQYVPKHVVDNPLFDGFNKHREIFCYTFYGIIPIPRQLIRELE